MDFDSTKQTQVKSESALAERLAKRASRRLVNQTDKDAFKPAMGLAFLGALGWNIPIPTFLGVLLGRWMDAHYKVAHVSWTLNFLLLGLFAGAFGAWQWLKREGIERAQKEQDRRNRLVDEVRENADEKAEEVLEQDELIDEFQIHAEVEEEE